MSRSRTGAHAHVLFSYLEKVFVVLVAVAAFSALSRLGDMNDQKQQRVTQTLLRTVADAAGKIANDPKQTGVAQPLKAIADTFQEPQGKAKLTPQELTVQIEHLADAAIWTDFKSEIEKTTETGPALATKLAKEDARARGRIAASHALIEAAVIHAMPPEQSAGWTRLADEKSSLHVLYEIIWYALLILGVLSCSYLLMTAFLALPFTQISGEWTKRIEEILKSAGPQAMTRVAIAPLAAAALVAGTVIAGTSYATVPGGMSRDVSREQTVDNRKTVNEGAVTYDYSMQLQRPGLTDTQLKNRLETSVNTINTKTAQETGAVTARVGTAIDLVNGVHESVKNVGSTAATARDLAGEAKANAIAATGEAKAAHASADAVQGAISDRSITIEKEQTTQKTLQSHELAQTTAVDERTFLRRNFGFTMFQVGPAVADALDQRMAREGISAEEQAQVRTALVAMQSEVPKNRWRFEEKLKEHMPAKLADRYFRTLLHLCALPRE